MYRLMIVEDEPIERETLKLMIRSNCDDITQIEDVANGFEAIKKCQERIPDIMIIDLNMPGISGLDTIKEVQKIDNNIKILILSAYNRFEFAQEAIKLGVEDFLIKPAKIDDIRRAIGNIIEKMEVATVQNRENTTLAERMEEIRPVLERDCIYAIVYAKESTGISQMLEFLGVKVASGFCFGVTYEKTPRMILNMIKRSFKEMGLLCIGEQFHNMLVFFMLDEKVIEERRREEIGRFVQMLLEERGYQGNNIGVGKIYEHYEDFFQSYTEVISVLKGDSIVEGEFRLYSENKMQKAEQQVDLDKLCRHTIEALKEENEQKLKDLTGWIMGQLIQDKDSMSKIGGLLHQFMTMVFLKLQTSYPDIELPEALFAGQILKLDNLRELDNYCYMQLRMLQQSIVNYRKLNHNLITDRALHCINEQYAGDINLNSVSKDLGISVFYLSKIIKKNTGKNFTDILAEKRLDEASKLLKENKSIKEVTYMVGFNSQNYFTKVFKKYIGCTPREYRQRGGC